MRADRIVAERSLGRVRRFKSLRSRRLYDVQDGGALDRDTLLIRRRGGKGWREVTRLRVVAEMYEVTRCHSCGAFHSRTHCHWARRA